MVGLTVQAAIDLRSLISLVGGLMLGADRYGHRLAMMQHRSLLGRTPACGFAPGYITMFIARLVIGMRMAGNIWFSATYVVKAGQHLRFQPVVSDFRLLSGGVVAARVYSLMVPVWGWRVFFIGICQSSLSLARKTSGSGRKAYG